MHLRINKIIGIAFAFFLLLSQADAALAIYSPVLSKEVGEIKGHVIKARQQNGVGSWLNAMEKVSENNAKWANEGKATGIPGMLYSYWVPVQAIFVQGFKESFLDGFLMLFYTDPETKGSITACLRNDIWEMQALQEQVLNELFKSSLLNDEVNSAVLWRDYNKLQNRIDGDIDRQIMGLKTDWGNTAYWFPNGETNYYQDCPFGDLAMAIEDASRSLDRLFDSDSYFKLGSMSMSSLWSAAEQRAVQRAADYIKKNQIKVSLGGSLGANPQGLVARDLGGNLVTAYERAVAAYGSFHAGELIGSIGKSVGEEAAAFSKAFWGKGSSLEVLNEYQNTLKARQLDLSRISNSLTLSLQLNHVSEQSLIDIERQMVEINEIIKQATMQKVLPKICEELVLITKKQCPDKPSNEAVSCQQ